METTTEQPPRVLQIASMFASLSAQNRRVVFAKGQSTTVAGIGTGTGTGMGRRSIESGVSSETIQSKTGASTTTTTRQIYYVNDSSRIRSRSSDSRPACLDLKVIDNKTKFDHAKALFENLERQSRQEQWRRTPHNEKKRVASPSPARSSPVNIRREESAARNKGPSLIEVTINKRDRSDSNTPDSCSLEKETSNTTTTIISANDGDGSCSTYASSVRSFTRSGATLNSSPTISTVTNANSSPAPPPVPPKPKFLDSPRTSTSESTTVNDSFDLNGAKSSTFRASPLDSAKNSNLKSEQFRRDENSATDEMGKLLNSGVGGGIRNYFSRLTHQQKRESENNGIVSTTTSWNTNGKFGTVDESKSTPTTTDISVNAALIKNSSDQNQSSEITLNPQKPSSLFEPYWRANRFGRQRLANGETDQSSPVNDLAGNEISPKRNFALKTDFNGSETSHSTLIQPRNDPGRLDITWPPPNNSKSPMEENHKDSGLGADSPSTSTTDSRASSSANVIHTPTNNTPANATTDWTKSCLTDDAKPQSNVALMTKEEASVLLSPSTRDVVLRESRGRAALNGDDDGEIRSLTSHLSIPQDVDLKRLSMCSMDSSSDQPGVAAADRYSIPEDTNINVLSDGHFWIEVDGLRDELLPTNSVDEIHYKRPSKVKFSTAPIRVFSTYTGVEYDRRNDDVDPVSASAEYELERRLEKMDVLDVELQKGPEGLGFSIIGMGVGADAGLEKLGIFVKSITPGGAVHRDGRICVCDQIVEVDGKSLVGVSQNYAASVLRSTSGTVGFKIGREKDLENSEIAALIRQSLEQDRILREQEDVFHRQFDQTQMKIGDETMRNNYLQPQWNTENRQSPLPSIDSVFDHDDDEPRFDRLMNELKQPPLIGNNLIDTIDQRRRSSSVENEQSKRKAFRVDGDDRIEPSYTAAEDISKILNETDLEIEDLETRFPSNGTEPETRRTAIKPTSQIDSTMENEEDVESLNGEEIQLKIDNLEAELSSVKRETDEYQSLLNHSKYEYDHLEKKYSEAKRLIKDYRDREKDLLDREEAHLKQLREKDQQYANLVALLKEKVVELERQLQDAHRKRASVVENAANSQPPSDISPALAYLPAKKLDASTNYAGVGRVRNVPIIVQPQVQLSMTQLDSTSAEIDRKSKSDFGVPETILLDTTAAKCKADVVKQSQTMAARALPSRRHETEVFIFCHHTLEHAHSLRAHNHGHCGIGNCGVVGSPSGTSASSPTKSGSTGGSGAGSPSTPRRLTARAALLLRKKATLNHANDHSCGGYPDSHAHFHSGGVGGGDLEKVPTVLTWNCDEVCRFLKTMGFEKYTPEFTINRIDGCKLLQLDGSRLKAMGVQNHSERSIIKKQIKEMKNRVEKERKQLEKESRRLLKLEKEKEKKK